MPAREHDSLRNQDSRGNLEEMREMPILLVVLIVLPILGMLYACAINQNDDCALHHLHRGRGVKQTPRS